MKPRIYKPILFCIILVIIFILGQRYYYIFHRSSNTQDRPAISTNKLSANLSLALSGNLLLKSNSLEILLTSNELQKWSEKYLRAYSGKKEVRINTAAVENYLKKISATTNSPPINARLTIENGVVTEFRSPQSGRVLNIPNTTSNILFALAHPEPKTNKKITAELAFDTIEPKITLEKVNNLGIVELLASGESDFGGSPKFRTQNIHVGAKKINGIILGPGENFSFNDVLGEVTASTGFVPELVIKSGTLTPEYGGGICQVSTTLFRAAMKAGLPILERHAHSLPVRYYNPQGYDATIYPGVSDLRFKNDTSAHILIQSKIVGSKIYFEIYGSKDARQVTIDGPHQYDLQTNGAMKAWLKRIVTYSDGQEKKDTFNSSYKSPSLFPVIRNPLE
ncbi:MAG: VanW family protein [Patescibacteria group bacterium]